MPRRADHFVFESGHAAKVSAAGAGRGCVCRAAAGAGSDWAETRFAVPHSWPIRSSFNNCGGGKLRSNRVWAWYSCLGLVSSRSAGRLGAAGAAFVLASNGRGSKGGLPRRTSHRGKQSRFRAFLSDPFPRSKRLNYNRTKARSHPSLV